MHHNWKHGRFRKYVAHEVLKNLAAGRKAFDGMPFQVMTDMEDFFDGRWTTAYTEFRRMAEDYPDAKFVMNLRPCADWIVSRTGLVDVCAHMAPDVVLGLVEHYFAHCLNVRDFFRGVEMRAKLFVMILGVHTVSDVVTWATGKPCVRDLNVDFARGHERCASRVTAEVLEVISRMTARHGDPCDPRWWLG